MKGNSGMRKQMALLAGAALFATPLAAQDSGTMGPPDDETGTGGPMLYSPELPGGTPADVAEAARAGTPVAALPQALRLAYWTSPSLLAQRAAVRSVDYRVPQARAAFGPRLDFQVDYSITRSGTRTPGNGWSDGTYKSATATAILTQPLFTFGRNAAAERFAMAQVGYQRQVMRSTEQQAMLDAIASYVGLLRDRTSVTIARDNLDTLERELSDNRARLLRREVTSTDVQQVETRVELGRAQVYTAQRDAAASEATFLRMVGAPAGALAAPNPLRLPVESLEQAYAYAEGHNPVLIAAQEREKVSRASLASAKADLMPRVDLKGQADYTNSWSPPSFFNTTGRQDQRSVSGQVVLSGPIYESGLRQARVGEAIAANDADWRLIDASLRENRATLASAWDDWKAQTAAIERFAGAVESARKAYDGALLQERAGLRTTLDVLDLARELLLARSNYNSAIAGAYVAQARVLAAMGALEQNWLLPDEARYDPATHFDKVHHKGDVPLLTPAVRALDALPLGNNATRPARDPSAGRTAAPVALDPVRELPVP